jgi:cyclopropane fatty-acyl-phospholipid synthase-like methyltransferase
MAEVTTGLRSILSLPNVYSIAQNIVGASRLRKEIASHYIRPRTGMKILDIGCGTGDILDYLPGVDYVGIDLSESYISSAKRKFGGRGAFHVGRAEDVAWLASNPFDVLLSIGVLHHLEDEEVSSFLDLAKSSLNSGARMVTADPCYHEQQSIVARYLANNDRGQNVRTEEGYRLLFERAFTTVKSTIRHDLLNIPYTHCILECSDPSRKD